MLSWFQSSSENNIKEQKKPYESFTEFREQKSSLNRKLPMRADKQKSVVKFLEHIVHGEQKEAEEMLKKDPTLVTLKGNVADYSGRQFCDITALKYAIWALDAHMWEMLLGYLTPQEIELQLTEMESQGIEYFQKDVSGTHKLIREHQDVSLHSLIKDLQEYFNYYNKSYGDHCKKQLEKISESQKKLPAHVAQEYLRSDRSFYPPPHFLEDSLPRIALNNDSWFSFFSGSYWYNMKGYAFFRGDNLQGRWIGYTNQISSPREITIDIEALTHLYETRAKEIPLIKKWVTESKAKQQPYPTPSAPRIDQEGYDSSEGEPGSFSPKSQFK